MSTTAGDFDVDAGVLVNIYQTNVGDPQTNGGYTNVSFDPGAFAEQTVRLRFAEVGNQLFLNAGVDNVRIAEPPAAIPVAGPFGLVLLTLLLVLAAGIIGFRVRAAG